MKVMVAVVLGAVWLAASVPARADWQFTKWGMTPEDVVKVSGGTARLASAAEHKRSSPPWEKTLATGSYKAAPYEFRADFVFDGRGLSTVSLKLADWDQYGALRIDLFGRYGTPVAIELGKDISGWVWRDEEKGHLVRYLVVTIIKSATITYAPLAALRGL